MKTKEELALSKFSCLDSLNSVEVPSWVKEDVLEYIWALEDYVEKLERTVYGN
jgi:hypothetical protein